MGTVSYATHSFYLLIDRQGSARLRRTYGVGRQREEYVFRVIVRIPHVKRPQVEGELLVELPPEIDPDTAPSAELAGPIEEG